MKSGKDILRIKADVNKMIYFMPPIEANESLGIYCGRKTVAAGNYSDEHKPSQVGTLKQLFSIWFWKNPWVQLSFDYLASENIHSQRGICCDYFSGK